MKSTYNIIVLTAVFAIALAATALDTKHLRTPFSDYSFGLGVFKIMSNKLNLTLVDWERVNPDSAVGIVFAYGFDSDYGYSIHQGLLSIPVTFRIAEAGPVRFGFGFEFQSFNMGNDWGYYGTHTLGPRFDFTVPLPLKNSYSKTGFTFGLGTDVTNGEMYYYGYDSEAFFIGDISLHEKIQIYFSDKIGMNFEVIAPTNVISGSYHSSYGHSYSHYVLDRFVLFFGPCFRW